MPLVDLPDLEMAARKSHALWLALKAYSSQQ
jgi:hypothetical protein